MGKNKSHCSDCYEWGSDGSSYQWDSDEFSCNEEKTQKRETTSFSGSLAQVAKYKAIIQVTINYPRTAKFLKSNSVQQKQIYKKLFEVLYHSMGMNTLEYDFVFEACKSGQIHLHGWFEVEHSIRVPTVLLSDMAKQFLLYMPKKYSHFLEAHIYPQYSKYRAPALCMKYINPDDEEDIITQENYRDYMTKCPV